MSLLAEVSPAEVRLALKARQEIVLIDLREEALFATGHPLFAAQLSLGRLEVEALDRIPRLDTLVVLYGEGDADVARAARTLAALGYSNLHALRGGLAGWREAGFELFQDVNSYSKAFGELVEHRRRTPMLSAHEVKELLDGGADVVVMDARPLGEFSTMSVPAAVNVPGAELVLRARSLAPDPRTSIIVNCAGRTRSLIGAQSLINAGVPNPVAALRNGTIGWLLAGLSLDRGRTAACGAAPRGAALAQAQRDAREVADRAGVRRLSAEELAALSQDAARTTYRFDVRAPENYAAGRLPDFRHAPGGQLVQEIDVFAPVRGARVVLFDDLEVRADMTASWLAQMGWDAYVLDPLGCGPLVPLPWEPSYPPMPEASEIPAHDLAERLRAGQVTVLDFATSREHARGHVPGAWFALRSQLAQALARTDASALLVFTSPDGAQARFAAAEAVSLGTAEVCVLAGGVRAWTDAGYPLEQGLRRLASEPIDVYRRPYEGVEHAREAMQAYLDWEFGLVAQLDRDATHGFHVI